MTVAFKYSWTILVSLSALSFGSDLGNWLWHVFRNCNMGSSVGYAMAYINHSQTNPGYGLTYKIIANPHTRYSLIYACQSITYVTSSIRLGLAATLDILLDYVTLSHRVWTLRLIQSWQGNKLQQILLCLQCWPRSEVFISLKSGNKSSSQPALSFEKSKVISLSLIISWNSLMIRNITWPPWYSLLSSSFCYVNVRMQIRVQTWKLNYKITSGLSLNIFQWEVCDGAQQYGLSHTKLQFLLNSATLLMKFKDFVSLGNSDPFWRYLNSFQKRACTLHDDGYEDIEDLKG